MWPLWLNSDPVAVGQVSKQVLVCPPLPREVVQSCSRILGMLKGKWYWCFNRKREDLCTSTKVKYFFRQHRWHGTLHCLWTGRIRPSFTTVNEECVLWFGPLYSRLEPSAVSRKSVRGLHCLLALPCHITSLCLRSPSDLVSIVTTRWHRLPPGPSISPSDGTKKSTNTFVLYGRQSFAHLRQTHYHQLRLTWCFLSYRNLLHFHVVTFCVRKFLPKAIYAQTTWRENCFVGFFYMHIQYGILLAWIKWAARSIFAI